MNNLTKGKIAMAVIAAIADEGLMNKEAAQHFGFPGCYLSFIKDANQYEQCSVRAWEVMRNWMYSGKKIKEYMPSMEPSSEENHCEPLENIPPVIIKIKPGVLEAREKVLKARRVTKTALKKKEIISEYQKQLSLLPDKTNKSFVYNKLAETFKCSSGHIRHVVQQERINLKQTKNDILVIGQDDSGCFDNVVKAAEDLAQGPAIDKIVSVSVHEKDRAVLTPDLIQKIILDIEVHFSIKQ